MFLFKRGLIFLVFISALFFSCEDPVLVYGSLELRANGRVASDFYPGKEIEISAIISEDVGNYTLYWKEDDGAFMQSNNTKRTFGPYEMSSRHTITAKVVFGTDEIITELDLNIGRPVDWNGALSVSGTNLVNENGKAIQLRGMSTHGLQYFNYLYNEKFFQSVSEDWHADIVRLSCYVNEGSKTYKADPEYWKQRIDTLVDWATKYGLYALIDWHQLTPGDPNHFIDLAKDFFEYMAEKHGNKPNVLFDICNEPNNDSTHSYDGTNWQTIKHVNPVDWNRIKEYADQIIPIIRAKSNNVIIVGTPDWAASPQKVASNRLNYDNIMYTMHFYAAAHKSNYMTNVQNAISKGIPVFVTEFGTQEASGNGSNNFSSSSTWLKFLQDNKISWCNWNFSNDYRTGAVLKTDYTPQTVEAHSDTANLKEAGKWILNKLNDPADDF